MTFTPEVWDGVLRRLQSEVPAFAFEAWLVPLVPRADSSRAFLVCPSSFHRERVRSQFLPQIQRCLRDIAGEVVPVELGIAQPNAKLSSDAASGPAHPTRKPRPSHAPGGGRRALRVPSTRRGNDTRMPRSEESAQPALKNSPQPALHKAPLPALHKAPLPALHKAPLRAPHTFDTFVVGSCNALAREAAFAIACTEQSTLNQLYLRAATGMGKTHLSRAVADAAKRMGTADVRYLSAERFTNEFLSALRNHSTAEFKKRYRGRRQLLIVEDVQFLESKQATQLEFFHTVQHVLDAGGKVVLTGDRMPHEMPQLATRLRSQLSGGLVAELEQPDAQVRRAILRSKAAHGGVKLPPDCLDLLVESVTGSVRDLESVLVQLVNTASLLKQPIDQPLTRDAISKKTSRVSAPAHRLDIASVIGVVAIFFQTSPDRLASRSRKKDVLLPRQLAMYLCRRYTDSSVSEIGDALGRDHPSVRNAILKIERAMLERAPLRYQVEALSDRLDRMLGAPGA